MATNVFLKIASLLNPEAMEKIRSGMRNEVYKIKADHDGKVNECLELIDNLFLGEKDNAPFFVSIPDRIPSEIVHKHRLSLDDIELVGGSYDGWFVNIKVRPKEPINVSNGKGLWHKYKMVDPENGHYYAPWTKDDDERLKTKS